MIDIDVSKIISEIGEPRARLIENEDEKRRRKITLISALVFLFLFICGTITFFILSRNAKAYAEQMDSRVKTIEQNNAYLLENEKEAQEVVKRNNSINQILNNNANWSYVFEKLEEVVPRGITFSDFSVTSPNDMQISGSSPDYVELSKLVVAMKRSGNFGDVNLTNASLSAGSKEKEQKVEFSITFSFTSKFNRETLKKASGQKDFDDDSLDIPGGGLILPNENENNGVTLPTSGEEEPSSNETPSGGGVLPVL